MDVAGFISRAVRVPLALWRRWRVRHDLYAEQPDRHPALAMVQVNELLPFKGTTWRVAAIRELPVPCVILTPLAETRASQVNRLRKLRRADRILTKQETQARLTLRRRAS